MESPAIVLFRIDFADLERREHVLMIEPLKPLEPNRRKPERHLGMVFQYIKAFGINIERHLEDVYRRAQNLCRCLLKTPLA